MEANTLFVVYRRHDESMGAPKPVEDSVASMGTAVQMLPGVWQLKTDQSGEEAFEKLREVICNTDQLLIIDMTNRSFLSWPDTVPFPPPSS